MTESIQEGVYKVVKTIASPLRFFGVVVGFLCLIVIALVWKSKLPPNVTIVLICITLFVVLVVILLVAILVIFYPKKLVFDQEAHLTVLREQLGDNELPAPYLAGSLPGGPPDSLAIAQQGVAK